MVLLKIPWNGILAVTRLSSTLKYFEMKILSENSSQGRSIIYTHDDCGRYIKCGLRVPFIQYGTHVQV